MKESKKGGIFMNKKCPWCGGELEKGTLRSNGSNYFLPEGKKPCKIRFYTQSYIEKANAIALPPDPYGGLFDEVIFPEAHACRNCKKIVISY